MDDFDLGNIINRLIEKANNGVKYWDIKTKEYAHRANKSSWSEHYHNSSQCDQAYEKSKKLKELVYLLKLLRDSSV